MSAMMPSRPEKHTPEFHRRSYRLLSEYMDRSRYGSMMLLLRERKLADPTARRRAGLDIVDVFSIGVDPKDPQLLHLRSRGRGDRTIALEHTYMYWAQLVTLKDFLEEEYRIRIPGMNASQKENGLLASVELSGAHMAKLNDGYVTWTFRLKSRGQHRCPEETLTAPADTVVSLGELGGVACAYCLLEQLNLNLP